jgi:hypothetical protein
MEALVARISEQDSKIQKVTAQIEINTPTTKIMVSGP